MLPLLSHSAVQTKDKSPRKLHISCFQRIWIWKTISTQMTNDETLNWLLHCSFLLLMLKYELLILMPAAVNQQISATEGPLPTPSICLFALSLLVLMEAASLNTFLSLNIKKKRCQCYISSWKMCTGWQEKKEYLKDTFLQIQGKDCPIVCGTHAGKLQYFYIKLKIL